MEWKTWITWWIIFCIRYSRLFWMYPKKHETITGNISIRIYIYEIEDRITFKIKTGYYLLTPETINFLGSTKSKITKDENGENVPRLWITEVVIIHCNIVNKNYQQDSRLLYTFVHKQSFGQLLDVSPKKIMFVKIFNSKFSYIELWFTD